MKSKLLVTLLTVTLVMASFTGCGTSSNNVPENTETETVKEEPTTPDTTAEVEPETESEPVHEHAYAEEVTTAPTCLADGITTFTCECGDTYTEPITATGHVFETYISNEDATYTADGTETAKCNNCDVTDTRTAEGSMLTYTYTDMDATMYAQQTVNVRTLPSTDGEKLGGLSTNDEVKVTGQCAETNWYRIEFNGNTAYVSNNYLGADKVVVQAAAPAQSESTSEAFPYELCKVYNDGNIAWIYAVPSHYTPEWSPEYCAAYDACAAWNRAKYPFDPETHTCVGWGEAVAAAGGNIYVPGGTTLKTSWYVNGERVVKVFTC